MLYQKTKRGEYIYVISLPGVIIIKFLQRISTANNNLISSSVDSIFRKNHTTIPDPILPRNESSAFQFWFQPIFPSIRKKNKKEKEKTVNKDPENF